MRASRLTAGAAPALAAAALAVLAAPSGALAQDAPDARLVPFPTCEALVAYAQEHLPRPPPYDPTRPLPPMPAPAAPQADAGSGAGSPEGDPDVSTTNVQEAGVDEPDLVKTDGRRVFAVVRGDAGARLVAVDGRASRPRVLDELTLPAGFDHELLLVGERLLVLTRTFGPAVPAPAPVPSPAPSPSPAPPAAAPAAAAGGPLARPALSPAMAPDGTLLTEVDVRGEDLRVARTLRIDGSLRAARLNDGIVRLVTASSPAAIVDRDASDEVAGWLPRYRVANRRTGRAATRAVSRCAQVRRPERFAGLGVLTVLTIDPATGLTPVDSDSILANVTTVYASRDALYAASPLVQDPTHQGAGGAQDAGASAPTGTLVHAFSTGARARTGYRASGEIPGHLLSQWSLSEHRGVLRAASTESRIANGRFESESYVTTLAPSDGRLVERGRVGGLGRGERIYAVRFIGDVGYVVTFRQVDPLYTVDLADPARPRVLGELKIPGYSAYLHPVGEDLLLGVGQDATEQGRRLGPQVSLFDVSNLRSPQRLATARLPGWGSEVEWDHHAFLYWPRTRLAVVPGSGEDGATTGFRITRAERLRLAGQVRHPGVAWRSPVRRSLVMGSRLLTLSDAGLMASDLGTLERLAWLPLDAPDSGSGSTPEAP